MATPRPRIRLSSNEITAGDVIEIKTLISHTMESGQRRDSDGNVIPRKIINTFRCDLDGQEVFSCDIEPAISANPYMEFTVKPEQSGTLTLTWIDDDGTEITETEEITVN